MLDFQGSMSGLNWDLLRFQVVLDSLYSQQQRDLKKFSIFIYFFKGMEYKQMNFAGYLLIPKLGLINLVTHLC